MRGSLRVPFLPTFLFPLLAGFVSAALPLNHSPAQGRETVYLDRAYLYAQGTESTGKGLPFFSCDDAIHLKIHWRSLPRGKNQLEVQWVDAQMTIWERSTETIWVKNESQSFLSDAHFLFKQSVFERVTGYELGRSKKAGRWMVKVRLNGLLMLIRKYDVEC